VGTAGGSEQSLEEDKMSNLVHNERVKYAATFFNNLGVAAFATGAIIPMFGDPTLHIWRLIFLIVGIGFGIFLMLCAFWLLGHLKE
jgi:hypothetical protein